MWSLSDESVFHINIPKEANPGLDFSAGGAYMAVAEKRSDRDCVGIYSCNPWAPLCVSNSQQYRYLSSLSEVLTSYHLLSTLN